MIKAWTLGAFVAALCAVVVAGAFAAAPSSTVPIGNSCTTLLTDPVFASIFPAYNGQAPRLAYHLELPQNWFTEKKETWKVTGNPHPVSGRIPFTHHLPGTSDCAWFKIGGATRVGLNVWYALGKGFSGFPAAGSTAYAGSPAEAWKVYSNPTSLRITAGKPLCPGGTPADGYDMRECAMQPVAGIGDRAAEGFGYIVFQEKGNTYEIGNRYPENPMLPYATVEAMAKKVAAEVAASPAPVDNVTCVPAPSTVGQCGPKPYS